jgi:two-component system sensor histidine kinase/response regulator
MLPFGTSLPSSENPSDARANTPLPRKNNPKKLVLILSKETDTRFLFKTLLEMWDYSVETAEDFEELINVAEQTRPSLILMDTALPFVENMTRMQQMRKNEVFGKSPIILLSGHAQPRFRNLALALGADDFLVKPVDFDLLEDCLKKNISRDENR